jgi:hypothetical protein
MIMPVCGSLFQVESRTNHSCEYLTSTQPGIKQEFKTVTVYLFIDWKGVHVVYLGWLTNSALVKSPNAGGRRGVAKSQLMSKYSGTQEPKYTLEI